MNQGKETEPLIKQGTYPHDCHLHYFFFFKGLNRLSGENRKTYYDFNDLKKTLTKK